MRLGVVAMVAAIGIAGSAAPAMAAVELWNQLETDVTIADARLPWPTSFGFVTDVRYREGLPGLERVQFRWGPRWDLLGPLSLAVNHTAYLQQPEPGVFVQEQRAELEPRLAGELGPIAWRDRSRLELRWRPDSLRWRYRNQLRLEVNPAPGWQPFVADEVFVVPNGPEINENRVTIGLAREVAGAGWELAYTWRTRHGAAADGEPDHLVTLAWFNALRRSPLLAELPPGALAD